MSDRFIVKFVNDVPGLSINWGLDPIKDFCYVLIDTKNNEIVGDDRMQPEDSTLSRDLSWVPYLLNEQQKQLDKVTDALRFAIECLQDDHKRFYSEENNILLEHRKEVIDKLNKIFD